MPFTIPDYAEAGVDRQAVAYQTDIDTLVAGMGGTGVLGGCAVTAQGTPDMTVAVAAGEVRIAGVNVAVSAGNGTITAADGTNPRIDLVTINSSGAIVVTAGTPASAPVVPDIPANSVPLAFVDVPASDSAIGSAQITDKRVLLPGGLYARAKTGSTYAYDIPGITTVAYTEQCDIQTDVIYYMPCVVQRTITVDRIACDVTAFNDAGDTMRMGLYRATLDWQPSGAPIIDEEVDTSTTGIKEAALVSAVTVYPGLYLLTAHASNLIRCRGTVAGNVAGMAPALGNDRYISGLSVAQAYGALPSTPVPWDTIDDNYQPAFNYYVYLRVQAVN